MSTPTGTFRTIARKDLQILVVDDFSSVRKAERQMLVALGVRDGNIADAHSGNAALAFLSSGQMKPDLIISDINMPEGNGLALLKAVKAIPAFKDIPVLMVTAGAERETIVAAAQAGAAGYLVKPFTGMTLEEKMTKAMRSSGVQLT